MLLRGGSPPRSAARAFRTGSGAVHADHGSPTTRQQAARFSV